MRLALFYMNGGDVDADELEYLVRVYLRSVTVHSRALEAASVKKEHQMLNSLLIHDAIESAPSFLHAELRNRHAAEPMASPEAVGRTVMALVKEVNLSIAPPLWTALYARDDTAVAQILEGLKPHHLALVARWKRATNVQAAERDAPDEHDEATPPYGETMLHMAAFVGHAALAEQLLESGAKPSCVGPASGCTALHAAAASDHPELCRLLIRAGAKVVVASTGKGYTALHLAC
eukprot:752735-Prymnesium_polylepis.1